MLQVVAVNYNRYDTTFLLPAARNSIVQVVESALIELNEFQLALVNTALAETQLHFTYFRKFVFILLTRYA